MSVDIEWRIYIYIFHYLFCFLSLRIKLSKSLDDNETYQVLHLDLKIIKVSFSTTCRIQVCVILGLFTYLYLHRLHRNDERKPHVEQLFIIIYNASTSSTTLNYEKSFAEGDNASSNVFSLAPTHWGYLRQWRSSRTRAEEGPVLSPVVRGPFYYPSDPDPRGLTWPPGPHAAPTRSLDPLRQAN